MQYNPALDGLRAAAIIAVVVHHYSYHVYSGGALGVDVFFPLSGYLITRLLIQDILRNGRVDFVRFYVRRARRLAPALVGALIFARLIWSFTDSPRPFHEAAIPVALYYANWVGVFHENHLGALSPLWSLSVEEQFYVVWPIALAMLLGYSAKFGRVLVVISLASLLLIVARADLFALHSPLANYFSTLARADELFAGAILALVQQRLGGAWPSLGGHLASWITPWLAIGLCVASLFLGPNSPVLYLGGFTVVAWSAGIMVIHVENAKHSTMARFLSSPALVWIGKRSYGIYVYHMPIFAALETFRVRHSHASLAAVTMARVVALAVVTWGSFRFVESPFLRRSVA